MAKFIFRDAGADGLEHRFVGAIGKCAVICTGADLDDAARHQLARTAAADRLFAVNGYPEPLAEGLEPGGEIELRIGHLGPAAEHVAMLFLFFGPAKRRGLNDLIIGEYIAEISGVIGGVLFNHRRRLDNFQDIGINPRWVEGVPGYVFG